MSTFLIYFADSVDMLVLREYFKSYTNRRACRNIDGIEEIDDVLEIKPRNDAIAFSLRFGTEKNTKMMIKTEDGTCTDTDVVKVEFKEGFAIIKQHSDHLLILVSNSSGSVETLNIISYALKEQNSRPIPTDIPEDGLEELLRRQKSITGTKVEKNTRVSSMTLDGELVNRAPDGMTDTCQEYDEEKGPKIWVRYVTFEKKTMTIYRRNPVRITCNKMTYMDLEEYVTKNVVPLITWAYREVR